MAALSQLAFSSILWGSILGVGCVFLYELYILSPHSDASGLP